MKAFGSSGPSFLVIWVLCFLALVTSSNCLYGHDIRGNGIFINQDGDVMDGKNKFVAIAIVFFFILHFYCSLLLWNAKLLSHL